MRTTQMIKKLAITAVLVCGSAHAQFYSGNEILRRMQSDSVVDKMIALGFVAGVSDAWEHIMFCPPEGSTTGQTRDIALRYLLLNPSQRHKPAAELVADALMEVWPCARRPNKGGKL